jgi:hypothetical protein
MNELNRDALSIVRGHYPRAVATSTSVEALFELIRTHCALLPNQLMFADSICCDDVNAIEYPRRAYEMLGPFKLGGLNGLPFAGRTGMAAFAGHVPSEGAVFIFYAPHIGVSRSGPLGSLLRVGQTRLSGCCGAAKAALARLQSGQIVKGSVEDDDYQFNSIEQLFLENKSRILEAGDPLYEATEVTYEEIHRRIARFVAATKFSCRYVVRIGAVLQNGDHDMGSFMEPRHAIISDLASEQTKDVLVDYVSLLETVNAR